MMKVDLGCGTNKQIGFIGVDRFPLADVDIVADIDRGLPFDDDSVDTVFASHSLEHVLNLTGALKEIYRICKHGAQICIVAPYSEQKLNISNPFHLHCFNEHTPRFWTNSKTTFVPEEQWVHPHASVWGLGESDHDDLGMDIRCIKMEFFYFPNYVHLSQAEQIEVRKHQIDVCDQIMYHLVVIKKEVSDNELAEMINKISWYDPPLIKLRRIKDNALLQTKKINTLDEENNSLKEKLKSLDLSHQRLERELQKSRETLKRETEDRALLSNKNNELLNNNNFINLLYSDLQDSNRHLKDKYQLLQNNNQQLIDSSKYIVSELESIKASKYMKFKKFLKPGNLWGLVGPSFQLFKDQSLMNGYKTKKSRLVLSENIQNKDFYWFNLSGLSSGCLTGISLAISYTIRAQSGIMGIEVVENDKQIIASASVDASKINNYEPVSFEFDPVYIDTSNNYYALRVFVKDVDVPITMYILKNRIINNSKPFIFLNWEELN